MNSLTNRSISSGDPPDPEDVSKRLQPRPQTAGLNRFHAEVVAVGLLFGLPGVVLAAPVTVLSFVLVKKLYVRQTLGEHTEVPGEDR